jgi:integrase
LSRGKLSAVKVEKLREPGRYGDGGGLWLQVRPSGKSWLFRYMLKGRARHTGLGPLRDVSLAEARAKASECRKLLLAGIDPLEARRAAEAQIQFEIASANTFKECAERYIASHEAAWRNPKHRQQWRNTLASYAYPVFGQIGVGVIDTGHVIKALEPIWTAKPETASRLRGRIESVLDWAKARGYRQGENPARWRGHLDHLLPARRKVRAVRHHAALPYAEVPAFLADLRQRDSVAARALEFTILTATRTSEAIGARWSEITGDVWTIPAGRMKSGREHRVPLAGRTLALVEELPRQGEFLFPGGRADKALSNMALLMALRRMGRDDITAHGFRSSFRDWVAERTNYPGELAEMALAHAVSDKVEAAYRRGDLFEKRRRLMAEWARYCHSPVEASSDVVALHG